MNGQPRDITGLRHDLDEVDGGIVRLSAQRSDIIAAIAAVKEGGSAGIQDAGRERQVLDGVAAAAGKLVSMGWPTIFRYETGGSRRCVPRRH